MFVFLTELVTKTLYTESAELQIFLSSLRRAVVSSFAECRRELPDITRQSSEFRPKQILFAYCRHKPPKSGLGVAMARSEAMQILFPDGDESVTGSDFSGTYEIPTSTPRTPSA